MQASVVRPSSVIRRVSTFSNEAEKPISHIAFIGGGRIIVILLRSDKNSGCYGTL